MKKKKTCFLQFQTKNSKMLDIQVCYRNNQISSNTNVSFLGLKIDYFLTWKDYIDVLIDKLNRSCFAIRSVKFILSLETLKMVYYSYVHSILNYGIIFCGNSSHKVKVFSIQKKGKHNRSGMVAVLGPFWALPWYIHTYKKG
jgi:hypothetical protein